MQKLVNINSLRDRFNVAERCEDCGRDGRYCGGDLYGSANYSARDICGILDDEPEVEAIPVEWLIDRANDPERAPLYRRCAQMLYEEWQKEQEEK